MATAAHTDVASVQMQLLLVSQSPTDADYLRNLLERNGDGHVSLQHVLNSDDALECMRHTTFDLLLCNFTPGEGTALRLIRDLRKEGARVPVVFLSDHVDEVASDAAIKAGASGFVEKSKLDHASLTRNVQCAIDLYCKERQRQRAENMLRKVSRAVERSADLVIITDRSGIIEYVNPAFETLTGYSRKEAIGRTPRILKSGHQLPSLYRELWETVLAGEVFRGVLANRKKNGEVFYAEKTITPLHDNAGKITHFISNDRDITERRRLEAQLHSSQRMDAVGKLAGGVAHDFNNLLMVISANAEMTLDSLAQEHPLRRHVLEIQTASRRAAELTRQLLAFGRKQVPALQLLDLNHVIQEIVKMLPRLIGEDIELKFMPGEQLGMVKADPVQLEQIVMNLAANARDAMPRGGKLTIESSAVHLDEIYLRRHSMVPAGNYVLLSVSDTGDGISSQHINHIFEPFYSTKEEGKGTGLGLATVYGIVKQSGGYIWVYSEPRLGTAFKIYLPRVNAKASSFPPPVRQEPVPNGCETILLVEDEAAVRSSTRDFLRSIGYIVLEAGNGQQALELARSYPAAIDLLMSDVVMPGISGVQLASTLISERPKTKVFFVSGYAESTVLRHGHVDVLSRFLQKPFSLKTMAWKLREILQSQPAPVISVRAASAAG